MASVVLDNSNSNTCGGEFEGEHALALQWSRWWKLCVCWPNQICALQSTKGGQWTEKPESDDRNKVTFYCQWFHWLYYDCLNVSGAMRPASPKKTTNVSSVQATQEQTLTPPTSSFRGHSVLGHTRRTVVQCVGVWGSCNLTRNQGRAQITDEKQVRQKQGQHARLQT